MDDGDKIGEDGSTEPRKYIVGGMVTVSVARERVQYLNADGKLITESLRDYTRINLTRQYDSLDKFLQAWNDADRKAVLIEELERQGVLIEALADEVAHTGLKDLDPFDLICHIAFDAKPLTRRERAEGVKKRDAFTKYGPQARAVLEALLEKYADEGVLNLDDPGVLKIAPFSGMGSVVELIRAFGGKPGFEQAVHDLQSAIYKESA